MHKGGREIPLGGGGPRGGRACRWKTPHTIGLFSRGTKPDANTTCVEIASVFGCNNRKRGSTMRGRASDPLRRQRIFLSRLQTTVGKTWETGRGRAISSHDKGRDAVSGKSLFSSSRLFDKDREAEKAFWIRSLKGKFGKYMSSRPSEAA